jgi:hypothetical protein
MKKILPFIWTLAIGTVASSSLLFGQNSPNLQITNGPVIEYADDHSATIAWSTNAASSSRIWYGTDRNNLNRLAESGYSSGTTHRVQIPDLAPGRIYYFQVESAQGRRVSGEAESGGVMTFRTVASGRPPIRDQRSDTAVYDAGDSADATVRITNCPVIEAVTENTATIAWSTNRRGSTRVTYGTDPKNLTQLAEASWGETGLTHRVQLKNLQPNTMYYYSVETGQAEGTGGEVESQRIQMFRTRPR